MCVLCTRASRAARARVCSCVAQALPNEPPAPKRLTRSRAAEPPDLAASGRKGTRHARTVHGSFLGSAYTSTCSKMRPEATAVAAVGGFMRCAPLSVCISCSSEDTTRTVHCYLVSMYVGVAYAVGLLLW